MAEWSGAPVTVDITGKTTPEMKNAAIVTLLNQNQTDMPWTIDVAVNDGYPILVSSTLNKNSFVAVKSEVLVYPTLANNQITITSSIKLMEANLYSISGSLVKKQALNGTENRMDVSSLTSGMYLLSIQTENGTTTHKIIKK